MRPHLEFAVQAWSPWLQGDKDTLESSRESGQDCKQTKEKHLQGKEHGAGPKTLEERRTAQNMALVHKFLTEKGVSGLFQRTSGQQRSRTLQSAGEHGLCVQYSRTDPRKNLFAMRMVEPWNRLPDTVKLAEKSEKFRAQLKKHQQ